MMYRLLSAVCLLLFSAGADAQKQYKVIAVGFYNCENFFDTTDDSVKKDEDFTPKGAYHYTEEVYSQKAHNIATVIEKMGLEVTPDGPAIVGLVEVENEVALQKLVSQPELKNRNYKICWFPTADERGISTAMLYNPKYFQLIDARPLRVPLESLGQKRPTRDVLHVFGVLAGDTVHVLVNHWPSKAGGEAASAPGRVLAAKVNRKVVDSLLKQDPFSKIIIMGDLNDNPTSEGITGILMAKSEKWAVGLNGLYNPYMNMYENGMGTSNYRGEWNLIDHIMVTGEFLKNSNNKWSYYNAEIFNRPFLVNKIGRDKGLPHRSFTISQVWDNGYSDHFPVLIYLIEKTN
jgi:endonuclease/exonuclease/phosphatase family metal-dependent hydrolase